MICGFLQGPKKTYFEYRFAAVVAVVAVVAAVAVVAVAGVVGAVTAVVAAVTVAAAILKFVLNISYTCSQRCFLLLTADATVTTANANCCSL